VGVRAPVHAAANMTTANNTNVSDRIIEPTSVLVPDSSE
jgi:hypothetical protein